MLKPFLIVPVLFLAPAFCQQTAQAPAPTTPPAAATGQNPSAIPPEYVGKANPVKPSPESQNRAKQIYGWDCAMCHGDNGDGKGDVAADQKLVMHDFRNSLKTLSDGEIFYIIHNGQGPQMPSEGPRAKTDEVWNLVIYLRKMSNTQAPAAPTSVSATVQ
ncbi:MAG TPA: c-type cytochrome [Acidobacteriaceae bacterium]|jgi:mono/diheme cytochrome c family protein|nr:c-type cytochrome [Acidobacteriaceae bacterium]